MKFLYFFITAACFALIYMIYNSLRKRKAIKKLISAPLPGQWKTIIEQNVPLYHRLPPDLKHQLHGLVNVFLAQKRFEGCGGLKITDRIKVTIAAQACIMMLNRPSVPIFRRLKTILVYPHTFIAKQDGNESVRLGESWHNGPVILAWDSVTEDARNINNGRNVVLHEFCHQLDQENGLSDGTPILENTTSYKTWARVLNSEYEKLRKSEPERGSVLDDYGSTNPAEFFAIATEAFFVRPKLLKKRHPELYDELKEYYKTNPAEW